MYLGNSYVRLCMRVNVISCANICYISYCLISVCLFLHRVNECIQMDSHQRISILPARQTDKQHTTNANVVKRDPRMAVLDRKQDSTSLHIVTVRYPCTKSHYTTTVFDLTGRVTRPSVLSRGYTRQMAGASGKTELNNLNNLRNCPSIIVVIS